MNLWVANALYILLIATPIITMEVMKDMIAWLERNHDWLSIIVWLLTMFVVYMWFSSLGFRLNP